MAGAAAIPRILYGTAWKEERSQGLTQQALEAGFRGIDCANQRKHYFEAAVGAAVRDAIQHGRVTRQELFLQTKFTFRAGQDQRLPYDPAAPVATQVEQSFQSSLEHFGTDYLDSVLLHGPSTRAGLAAADEEAWRALEGLAQTGRARHVGVSNVTAEQLRALLGLARVKPSFVQNRCYARSGWDREVRRLCGEHGLVYQGFSLLTANQRELEQRAVRELARARGVSAPQLVFALARAVGMLPLTGTSSAEHMQQDLAALDLELAPHEARLLEQIAG